MALRGEVVDLVRPALLDDANQVRGIGQVTVVKPHPDALFMRVPVQMIDSFGVERRRTPFHSMDFVSLLEQELRKIRAVLARDTRNQRGFFHG